MRACGIELGLPYEMVYRQPFPGPGLGVRCLGAITRDRLEAVRESDAILREEFHLAGLDKKMCIRDSTSYCKPYTTHGASSGCRHMS